MKITKPAVAISVYEDVFNSEDFLVEIEKECDNEWSDIQWQNSGVGAGSVGSYRTSVSTSLHSLFPPFKETELSKLFSKTVKYPVQDVVKDYINEYFISNGICEEWQLLKYFEGAEYKAHWDCGPNAPRMYSMIAVLQAPEKGGELEFPNFKVKLEIKTGSVIMFPAAFPYLHIAHPVEKGVKYSLVTWFK